jgi:hypothetical protein
MSGKAIKGIALVLVRSQVPDQGALSRVFAKLLYLDSPSLDGPPISLAGCCWLALANSSGLCVKRNTKFWDTGYAQD